MGLFHYQTIFPNFVARINDLHTDSILVAFVICVGAFALQTLNQRDADGAAIGYMLVKFTAVIALMTVSQFAIATITTAVWDICDSFLANPYETVYNQFQQALSQGNGGPSTSILGILNPSNIFAAIVSGLFYIIIFLCLPAMFLIYLFQFGFAQILYAFSPIAIACLATSNFKSYGIQYIQTTIGILLWPLGIVIVLLGTLNILEAQLPIGSLGNAALLASVGGLIKLAFASVFTIFGVIVAPMAISSVVKSGGSIGGALASASAGMMMQAVTMGSSAVGAIGARSAVANAGGGGAASGGSESSNVGSAPGASSSSPSLPGMIGGGGPGGGSSTTNAPSGGGGAGEGAATSAGPSGAAPIVAAAGSGLIAGGATGGMETSSSGSSFAAQASAMNNPAGDKVAKAIMAQSIISTPVMN